MEAASANTGGVVWPRDVVLAFAEAFVEDSLADRQWVEEEHKLVDEMLPWLRTPQQQQQHAQRKAAAAASKLRAQQAASTKAQHSETEEEVIEEVSGVVDDGQMDAQRQQVAYQAQQEQQEIEASVSAYIVNAVREQLTGSTRDSATAMRGTLKLLTSTAAIPEVREVSAKFLEDWLNNPASARHARELLSRLLQFTGTTSERDISVVNTLVQMKTKAGQSCIVPEELAVLMRNNRAYSPYVLRLYVAKELASPVRPVYDAKMYKALWTTMPHPDAELGAIFAEVIAANKQWQPCSLFKRLRSSSVDIAPGNFCSRLFECIKPSGWDDPMLASVVNFACLAAAVCAPMSVLDPNWGCKDAHQKAVLSFLSSVADLQVSKLPRHTVPYLRKLLLLEKPDVVPPELTDVEKRVVTSLCWETQASSAAVLSPPVTLQVLVEMLEVAALAQKPDVLLNTLNVLVRKAAMLHKYLGQFTKQKVLVLPELSGESVGDVVNHFVLLTRCTDAVKEGRSLYTADLLWKALLLLVTLSAFSPEHLGCHLWKTVPTARSMMEMLITRRWHYPIFADSDESEAKRLKKVTEKDAAAKCSLTALDKNAARLPEDAMPFKIRQKTRTIPPHVVEQLRSLQQNFGIGTLLLQSPQPSFLSELLAEHTVQGAMSWFAPIIEAEPASIEALPVPALCELVVSCSPAQSGGTDRSQATAPAFLDRASSRVRKLLFASSEEKSREPLTYFLAKLSHPQMDTRNRCHSALKAVLVSQRREPKQRDQSEAEHHRGWHAVLDEIPLMQSHAGVVLVCEAVAASLEAETSVEHYANALLLLKSHQTDYPAAAVAVRLGSSLTRREFVSSFLYSDAVLRESAASVFAQALSRGCDLDWPSKEEWASKLVPVVAEDGSTAQVPDAAVRGAIALVCLPREDAESLPGPEETRLAELVFSQPEMDKTLAPVVALRCFLKKAREQALHMLGACTLLALLRGPAPAECISDVISECLRRSEEEFGTADGTSLKGAVEMCKLHATFGLAGAEPLLSRLASIEKAT
eukprot:m51a1_g13899 hypothetical protein (1036) ;mRNA; r:743032-746819